MMIVCPNCGNTDFGGTKYENTEEDMIHCPVPGCGTVFRRSRIFSWEPPDLCEIIALHPLSRHIHLDDTIIVHSEQAAAFSCGGQTFWLEGPTQLVVGYEWRSESELQTAGQNRIHNDFPSLINTNLVFFDLRLHPQVLVEAKEIHPFWCNIAVLPFFRLDLAVRDPQKLHKQFPANESLPLSDLIGIVGQRLQHSLEEQLRSLLPPNADEAETVSRLELVIRDPSLKIEDADSIAEDIGLSILNVRIESCTLHRDWCSVCGQAVIYPDMTCPSGHRIRWCPECHSVIHQTSGRCGNGHLYVFCPYCRMNVLNRCAIHHGGTGPFQPDMKMRGE